MKDFTWILNKMLWNKTLFGRIEIHKNFKKFDGTRGTTQPLSRRTRYGEDDNKEEKEVEEEEEEEEEGDVHILEREAQGEKVESSRSQL